MRTGVRLADYLVRMRARRLEFILQRTVQQCSVKYAELYCGAECAPRRFRSRLILARSRAGASVVVYLCLPPTFPLPVFPPKMHGRCSGLSCPARRLFMLQREVLQPLAVESSEPPCLFGSTDGLSKWLSGLTVVCLLLFSQYKNRFESTNPAKQE